MVPFRSARVLTARVLTALAVTALAPTACEPPTPDPATGIVSSVRPDPGAPERRLLVTIQDAEGHEWNVRLPLDTACVQDAAYPACAG